MSDIILKYSCVLFDLDGTILDTVADCSAAINRTMDDFSFPHHTNDEVRSYLNNGARILIQRALPEKYRDNEALVSETLSKYLKYYSEECLKASKIYDGIEALLKNLRICGAKLGVVTNKPDIQTKLMIPHYFGNLFDYFEGNSEHVPTKPDKIRVESAISALNKKADQTIFVGDSAVDVQTARNAGIPCIGVAWGFAGKAGFNGYMPDYIAEKPDEIFEIARFGL